MAKIEVVITGDTRVTKLLKKYGVVAVPALASAMFAEGERIMAESKAKFVPVDTGNLKSTGHVKRPRTVGSEIRVVLGYGGPAARYALKVHENPRSGKTGGVSPSGRRYRTWAKVGQWKYLSAPFKKRKTGLDSRLAKRMVKFLQREGLANGKVK